MYLSVSGERNITTCCKTLNASQMTWNSSCSLECSLWFPPLLDLYDMHSRFWLIVYWCVLLSLLLVKNSWSLDEDVLTPLSRLLLLLISLWRGLIVKSDKMKVSFPSISNDRLIFVMSFAQMAFLPMSIIQNVHTHSLCLFSFPSPSFLFLFSLSLSCCAPHLFYIRLRSFQWPVNSTEHTNTFIHYDTTKAQEYTTTYWHYARLFLMLRRNTNSTVQQK